MTTPNEKDHSTTRNDVTGEDNNNNDDDDTNMENNKSKLSDVGVAVAKSEGATATTTTTMTIQLTLTALPGAPRVPLDLSSKESDTSSVVLTSSELRQLVSTKTNIPLSVLRLIYRGRLITDNNTTSATTTTTNVITEYKLENGSVLHCMGKPQVVTTSETTTKQETATTTTTSTAGPSSTASTTNSNAPGSTSTTTSTLTPSISATATNSTSSSTSVLSPPSPTVPSLQSALDTMRTSNSTMNYNKCIKTLQKVLLNIIDHPLEEKYRTIKVNNTAFQKQFHHVQYSTTVLRACGFQYINENTPDAAAYTMDATPERWSTLLQAKVIIDRAVQQSTTMTTTATTTAAVPSFGRSSGAGTMMATTQQPTFPFPPSNGDVLSDPAVLQQTMANFMSNPEQMQAMMQNPMVQSMIRNDPRLANVPHLQQAMDMMMNNPQMMERMHQFMSDPNYQDLVSSPEYIQNVQQQLRQSLNGTGSGTSGNNPLPSMFPPNMFVPPNMQPPSSSSTTPWGHAPTPTTTSATSVTNNNGTTTNAAPARSDDELTEEEMIAEAIRRSLQDNNNNGP